MFIRARNAAGRGFDVWPRGRPCQCMSAQTRRGVRDEAIAGRAGHAAPDGMGYAAREKLNKGGNPLYPQSPKLALGKILETGFTLISFSLCLVVTLLTL